MPTDAESDQSNLLALQQGEAAALNRLIARWQRPLHSFAFRYCQNQADADDLTAQAFVKLYQQRLRLRPDTRLSAWLFTTLTNLCHNHHRWRQRHPTVRIGGDRVDDSGPRDISVLEIATDEPGPDTALERDEAAATVRGAISALPHDLRVTLLLHHFDHLSYREIGEITGCSERGVETRLYRARQRLREQLSRPQISRPGS